MADINLNFSPYFDDFDPSKDYVRVLFRPGFPVQARELTTMQSFLQEQIRRHGDHVFRDGSRVTSAEIVLSNDVHRIALSADANENVELMNNSTTVGDIGTLEGLIITDAEINGTVKARVIKQPTSSSRTAQIGDLYVKYITAKTFADVAGQHGGYIYATKEDNPSITADAGYVNTYTSTNQASIANIAEGIFYVNGIFTRVEQQTVVVDANKNTPSAKIGFSANPRYVTQNEDTTLFDNARGTTNEGAPGAHRLQQELTFSIRDLNAAPDITFFNVLTVENGITQEVVKENPEYAELGKTLARRTYDESGNYSLTPFSCQVVENTDNDKFDFIVGPSKAYVEGYEVNKKAATTLTFEKESQIRRVGASGQGAINYTLPGTTYIEIAGDPANVLPGFDNNNPFAYTNRLIFRNEDGDDIAFARPYTFIGSRLYFYDVKNIQTFTVSSVEGIKVGNDIYTSRARGFVHSIDDDTNEITVIGANNQFTKGEVFSDASSWGVNGRQISEASDIFYTLQHTRSITEEQEDNPFLAIADSDGNGSAVIGNANSELVTFTDKHWHTAKEGDRPYDNSFNIIASGLDLLNSSTINDQNSNFTTTVINDGGEIKKELKFAYMHITSNNDVNYGWSSRDREISLHYSDIYNVYEVRSLNTNISDSLLPGNYFNRVTFVTDENQGLTQGTIIDNGKGVRAIIALSNELADVNSANFGRIDTRASSNTHETITSVTNSVTSTTVEVVYLTGSSFSEGDVVTIETPPGEDDNNSTITISSITATTTSEDITGLYLLDNGQRAEMYDIGRLVRKNNRSAPGKDLIVFFSYFESNPTRNHYYNVDSYEDLNFYSYDVRFYDEPQEILPSTSSSGRDLRNALDFRFKVIHDSDEPLNTSTDNPLMFDHRNFYNQSRIYPGRAMNVEFDEYLGRIDTIGLQTNGSFKVNVGKPAINPAKPQSAPNSMDLFTLTIPAGVRYASDIEIEKIDNRRYTMRDIGNLESRIGNLEQAVALSLLESQALHDNVSDRTKLGFAVDDFSTPMNSILDVEHDETNCAVLPNRRVMQPPQTNNRQITTNWDSAFSDISHKPNISDWYWSEGFIVKDFDEVDLGVKQERATRSQLINPFGTWQYYGSTALTPPSWPLPPINVNSYYTRLNGVKQKFNTQAEWEVATSVVDNIITGVEHTEEFYTGVRTTRTRVAGGTQVRTAGLKTTISVNNIVPKAEGDVIITPTGSAVKQITEGTAPEVDLEFSADGLRPNTEHEAFFGNPKTGNELTVTVDGSSGETFMSDAEGKVTGTFHVPAGTPISAGTIRFVIRDVFSKGFDSSATTTFNITRKEYYFDQIQPLVDKYVSVDAVPNVTINSRFIADPPPPPREENNGDPIAQTFRLPAINQAGTDSEYRQLAATPASGTDRTEVAFLTSIDLWFAFIDNRANMGNVNVQIRETVNGYPAGPDQVVGETGFVNIGNETAALGSEVGDSTKACNFKFKRPTRLTGDKEYCIVVMSPSELTSVWVADIGEELVNGDGIHDRQPNVGGHFGSFFVSQNQTTWTATQEADLAFKLYRAEFVEDDAEIRFNSIGSTQPADKMAAGIGFINQGLPFETFEGETYVRVRHPNHGFNPNDAVTFTGIVFNETTQRIEQSPGNTETPTGGVINPTKDTYFINLPFEAIESGLPNVGDMVTATQNAVFDHILVSPTVFKNDGDTVTAAVRTVYNNSINMSIDGSNIDYGYDGNPRLTAPYEDIELDFIHSYESPRISRNSKEGDVTVQYTLSSKDSFNSPVIRRQRDINPNVFRNSTGKFLTSSGDLSGSAKLAAQQSTEEISAYVTKRIDLDMPADGINVKFEADIPPGSEIIASYKIKTEGDETPFNEVPWVDFGTLDETLETFTSTNEFKPYTLSVEDLPSFTQFKVRLRMQVENEARVPQIKDLRIIADF